MHLLCQVAIKSIRKERIVEDLDRIHIQREIEITASLRHPNIIRFHEGRSHIHRGDVLSPLQTISHKIKTESQICLRNCSRLFSSTWHFSLQISKFLVVISRAHHQCLTLCPNRAATPVPHHHWCGRTPRGNTSNCHYEILQFIIWCCLAFTENMYKYLLVHYVNIVQLKIVQTSAGLPPVWIRFAPGCRALACCRK